MSSVACRCGSGGSRHLLCDGDPRAVPVRAPAARVSTGAGSILCTVLSILCAAGVGAAAGTSTRPVPVIDERARVGPRLSPAVLRLFDSIDERTCVRAGKGGRFLGACRLSVGGASKSGRRAPSICAHVQGGVRLSGAAGHLAQLAAHGDETPVCPAAMSSLDLLALIIAFPEKKTIYIVFYHKIRKQTK